MLTLEHGLCHIEQLNSEFERTQEGFKFAFDGFSLDRFAVTATSFLDAYVIRMKSRLAFRPAGGQVMAALGGDKTNTLFFAGAHIPASIFLEISWC